MKKPKFGATNDFPRGKFNADDEGGLRMGVTVKDKTLIIDFGKPVAWIGLGKGDVERLIETLRNRLGEL